MPYTEESPCDGEPAAGRRLADSGANLSSLDERAREPFARAEPAARASLLRHRLASVERRQR